MFRSREREPQWQLQESPRQKIQTRTSKGLQECAKEIQLQSFHFTKREILNAYGDKNLQYFPFILFYSLISWRDSFNNMCNLSGSQDESHLDWEGPLEIISFNPPGSPRGSCSGPCPLRCWVSPRMEAPQFPCITYYSVWPPSQWTRVFLHSGEFCCF